MKAIGRMLAITAAAAWLAACAINATPPYDPALVAGLRAQNEKALILFSAVSAGAPKAEFSARPYDEVIGGFDALRVQAQARNVPPLARKLVAQMAQNGIVAEICGPDPAKAVDCINSSPRAIAQITATFRQMKTLHQGQGLAADIVAIQKTQYEASIQQALVVETALKPD